MLYFDRGLNRFVCIFISLVHEKLFIYFSVDLFYRLFTFYYRFIIVESKLLSVYSNPLVLFLFHTLFQIQNINYYNKISTKQMILMIIVERQFSILIWCYDNGKNIYTQTLITVGIFLRCFYLDVFSSSLNCGCLFYVFTLLLTVVLFYFYFSFIWLLSIEIKQLPSESLSVCCIWIFVPFMLFDPSHSSFWWTEKRKTNNFVLW